MIASLVIRNLACEVKVIKTNLPKKKGVTLESCKIPPITIRSLQKNKDPSLVNINKAAWADC